MCLFEMENYLYYLLAEPEQRSDPRVKEFTLHLYSFSKIDGSH
jgi:hypothetical protein